MKKLGLKVWNFWIRSSRYWKIWKCITKISLCNWIRGRRLATQILITGFSNVDFLQNNVVDLFSYGILFCLIKNCIQLSKQSVKHAGRNYRSSLRLLKVFKNSLSLSLYDETCACLNTSPCDDYHKWGKNDH